MKTRFGDVLFWTGVIGAAICMLYAVDTIWIHQTGRSILQISGGFQSREDMLTAVAIGIVLACLFGGAGVAARSHVNKSAEIRAAAIDSAEIEDAPAEPSAGQASSQVDAVD